jgi:1,4-alpha-glucan branching enzyme
MWTHPGKKLLFMGDDIAQWNEWNHDESLQWHLLQWDSHRGVQRLVEDLNRLYRHEPALYQVDFQSEGFEWIDCMSSESSVLAYTRKALDPSDYLVVVANFTPVPRQKYRIGVPEAGFYEEVFNSDAALYGGSDLGNYPGLEAKNVAAQGHVRSIAVNLPPLAVAIFKPKRST